MCIVCRDTFNGLGYEPEPEPLFSRDTLRSIADNLNPALLGSLPTTPESCVAIAASAFLIVLREN